jgi:hypothetical protein
LQARRFFDLEPVTIPGLQRNTPLRYVLHCARETAYWKLMAKRYFVYILANKPQGVMYVGVTNDLPAAHLSTSRRFCQVSRADTA